MSAQLLAFRPSPPENAQALLAAVVELHALITIDPVLGASPTRVYFVFDPEAKARVAAAIDLKDRCGRPPAYAVIGYDFPFALHLLDVAAGPISGDRAKAIASASAGLQGEALRTAAAALGIKAQPVTDFDAEALKTLFFPNTQETVTHLLRLELRGS
jgi:hypothetical protein